MHVSSAPSTPPPPALVSKAEFARLIGVSKPRVSQYFSEGKIGREALVGDGPGAKVNLALAKEHLRLRLDVGQRLGNGLDTKIDLPVAAAQPPLPITSAVQAPASDAPSGAIEEQLKRARLEGYERDNRKKAEDEAARAGRYVETIAAQQEMAKIASQLVTIFEGGLPQIAAAFAAQFKIPQRDALHLLRNEFRTIRSGAASALKEEALSAPETVEVDVAPPASELPPHD